MTDLGPLLPSVPVPPPGPRSRALARRLRAVESRNVTFLADDFPVFWEAARGANVRDADGNVYLDLTAAFGVALSGHADPLVLEAVSGQAARMVHGMGDVHPPVPKLELLEALTGVVGEAMPGWDAPRAVLASTGSEAVEIALKTARLASGRGGVVAFSGGYHGLTLGALSATARPYFREPFSDRLPGDVTWLPFPTREEAVADVLDRVDALLAGGVGAVVVEPVQARGGVRVPGPGFGAGLGELARRHGAVLIADEIYTGLGRCGAVLASSRVGLEPDVVCLGKVLGGGLPLSACVAPARVMDAWPPSPGEALHTSTFLGHPLACAAGLAMLRRVADGLQGLADALGRRMLGALSTGLAGNRRVRDVRGLGLLLGVEVEEGGGAGTAVDALRRGLLVLPAGDRAQVVELSPPAILTGEQEEHAVTTLIDVLGSTPGGGLP